MRNCQKIQKNKKLEKNRIVGGVYIGDKSVVNSGNEIAKPYIPSKQLKNTARIKK